MLKILCSLLVLGKYVFIKLRNVLRILLLTLLKTGGLNQIILTALLSKDRNINNKAKKITENLPVADRIDKLQEKEAHITIKDHKDDLPIKYPVN